MKERIEERERTLSRFLEAEKGRLALACHAMARAFARGATLVAHGTGAARTDAAHVAVEFMHPVIVGKRALPALARAEAGPDDIRLGIVHGPGDPSVEAFLAGPSALSIALSGGTPLAADFAFAVPSEDPQVVQEVQETAYHVLWELVHVFFEQPGLLDEACITCGDVAVQARVVALAGRTATIELDGLREEVAVDLVQPVAVGDTLLCHAGVALERVG